MHAGEQTAKGDSQVASGDIMTVDTAEKADARQRDIEAEKQDEAANGQPEDEKNKNFVQVYPKGWNRLRVLIQKNPQAARVWAFLAEHIDQSIGAVLISQKVLAEEFGVHRVTINRYIKYLEDEGALVKIKVDAGVYAYALDPDEVWRAWNGQKDLAAFRTRTLVRKSDRANRHVKRRLKVMLGEPELPFEGDDEGDDRTVIDSGE